MTAPLFKTTTDWYNSLNIIGKYRYVDETKVYEDIVAKHDVFETLPAHTYFSRDFLRNILTQKSRVIMFGAGGTASWFLPKLLKIYNDAFTKCPDFAYPLEIVVIDGDEV